MDPAVSAEMGDRKPDVVDRFVGIFWLWAFIFPGAGAQRLPDPTGPEGRVYSGPETYGANLPADALTLFVYPPSDPIDYESPSSALWSLFRIEAKRFFLSTGRLRFTDHLGQTAEMKLPYRSSIGHTITCVSCTLPEGTAYTCWVSLSSLHFTDTAIHLLVNDRAGLAFLFHDFSDGTLIQGDENLFRLVNYTGLRPDPRHRRRRHVHPRYLSFPLSDTECAAVKDMIDFYESFSAAGAYAKGEGQDGPGRQVLYFSTRIDPFDSYQTRKRTQAGMVGGGCAPFGVGLIKAGSRHTPIFDRIWKRKFRVSGNLMETGVSVTGLLFGRAGSRWVHPGHPFQEFGIYDPELIWAFIGTVHQYLSDSPGQEPVSGDPLSLGQWLDREGLDARIGPEIRLLAPSPPGQVTGKNGVRSVKATGKRERVIQGVILATPNPESSMRLPDHR